MSSKRIALDRTLVVGVDVASEEHVALIRGPAGLEIRPFPFANDRSGFRLPASKVSEPRAASEVEEVALALEPTGSYGEALARWAKRKGWQVLGVLGAHTRRAKELWGNSPLKSDAKDARVICDLAVEGKERWLNRIPYGACLLSMPGVGVVTPASLLGECGNLRDYPGTGELLKFCGLNVVSFSSGKRRGRNRISKRGSGLVRHQLYLLAGRLVKQDSAWRAAYNRLRHRGAARKAALIALSRKAVRVLFAMVRDNALYSSPIVEEDLKLAA